MKNLFIALFAMIIMVSCSTTEQYVVKGTLEGSSDEVVYLQKREGGKLVSFDSTVIADGSFEFAPATVDYPEMHYFAVKGKRGQTPFFLENSEITITGHVDTIYNAAIVGSASQAEYDDYNSKIDPYYKKNSELYQEFRAAKEAGDEDLAAELTDKRGTVMEELNAFQAEHVKANPASFVTPVILRSISFSMEVEDLDASLNALDESLAVSSLVQELKDRVVVLRKVQLGAVAPDFTQNDTEGNPVTLSGLTEHKYLLVDFWAAWCGPCRAENPNVVAVYNEFKDKGFDVLGVSLDRDKEAWLEAIEKDELAWTQVSDLAYWDNAVAKTYAVNSIPANFLLDAEGKIIAKGLRGEDLRTKIAELLAE